MPMGNERSGIPVGERTIRRPASGGRSAPHPWGSRFGDVTWARIVRGGIARIERGLIPSRWDRTARAGVDFVALGSHCASRAVKSFGVVFFRSGGDGGQGGATVDAVGAVVGLEHVGQAAQ